MALNKQRGNMYEFVTHTWNPVRGKCEHDCDYCYMRGRPVGKTRVDDKALKDSLGKDNYIFVGSSTDMFAKNIPDLWIEKSLARCRKYDNHYLFQTKNPGRFYDFIYPGNTTQLTSRPIYSLFPKKTMFGTTVETNRTYNVSKAPNPLDRMMSLMRIPRRFGKMITIEPIMDFDIDSLATLIEMVHPDWVNIGADSKGHHLPEPSFQKLQGLIICLEEFTVVKQKKNLDRLKGKK